MALQALFLDFGGCIDAPGIHTRTLFWRSLRQHEIVPESARSAFQESYTRADQRMMASGEAKGMGLRAFNRHNAELITQGLLLPEGAGREAGDRVTEWMTAYIEIARPVIAECARRLPVGIISNFTGNLPVILEEFSLAPLLYSVTESFYTGSAKPDLGIFRQALAKHRCAANEGLYVGDNPVNDIAPARALGMKTALVYETEYRDCGAEAYLKGLGELPALLGRF